MDRHRVKRKEEGNKRSNQSGKKEGLIELAYIPRTLHTPLAARVDLVTSFLREDASCALIAFELGGPLIEKGSIESNLFSRYLMPENASFETPLGDKPKTRKSNGCGLINWSTLAFLKEPRIPRIPSLSKKTWETWFKAKTKAIHLL
ncbi:O-succinylhomoserine sulfhydrylase [Striga asiatica]|uniref:O-succinylhomoserine sulfhydrylase n=1 Tax=Striga asiatica TaxID=4170 RepID=A0A5A7Q1H5_STRAF|nr:O-succinylhomoserine sulfhydrylase [Striga asiatica]